MKRFASLCFEGLDSCRCWQKLTIFMPGASFSIRSQVDRGQKSNDTPHILQGGTNTLYSGTDCVGHAIACLSLQFAISIGIVVFSVVLTGVTCIFLYFVSHHRSSSSKRGGVDII